MPSKRHPFSFLLSGLCSALILLLLLAGCGGDNTQTPSAQQLLKDAQTAIQKVTSYHFNLTAQNIGSNSALPIQSADGDLVVPNKLKANATVLLGGASLQTQLIAIDSDEYVYVLTSWQKTTEMLDPRKLTPGLALLLGQLQNPGTPGDSTSASIPCWSINGKLDASYLAAFTGGGAPAGTMDDVTVCIGKSDKLPYLLTIKGIAAQGDTAQTTRTLKFSKYNEQVTITAPPVVNAPAVTPTP